MRELEVINYDLRNGYIPDQFNYRSPQNDRNIFIKHFPLGFMNLPNADKIIDRTGHIKSKNSLQILPKN